MFPSPANPSSDRSVLGGGPDSFGRLIGGCGDTQVSEAATVIDKAANHFYALTFARQKDLIYSPHAGSTKRSIGTRKLMRWFG